MQKYKEINGNDYVKNSRTTINETMQSIQSMNSGTAFPTTNLFEGMKCYRTDLKKTYTLTDAENNTWVEDAHATLSDEATHAASATKLQTARSLNLGGAVTADAATFDGTANATINVKTLDATKLKGTASVSTTGNAATATKVVATAAAGASANIAEASMASNNLARIRVSGATNAGELALETADDGSEPIVARQYTGAYTNAVRTAKILDESGNTSFPGTVVAPKFTGSLNGNAATATKLATPRTLALTGKAAGSATFDGSANASINVTSVNADTASKLSTAREINITGNATGAATFDGTSDVSINVSVSQAAHADRATADKYGADIADNYIKHYINVRTQDLNDIRTGGLYAQPSNTNATTARHYPENEACSILVIQNGANGVDGCTQICTTFASHNSYKREYDVVSKTWSAWRRYAFEDSTVSSAQKLSTARKINITGNATGAATFDGTSDVSINVSVSQAAHADKATADANGNELANAQRYMHVYDLPNNTDFNNVKTTGIYTCTQNSYTNRPASSWGVLRVYWFSDNVKQEYVPDNRYEVYERYFTGGKWNTWSKINAANADTATSATTAGNVSNKIYYSADSPSVATDKLFAVKQAHKGDDNVPNNGLVIQTGPTGADYNGKLYITDNGCDGVWVGGVAAGKEVGWQRLVENHGSWNINSATATNADKLDGYHASDLFGKIYPVGSIYMSMVATNPASLFGIGTWKRISQGRMLLGADDSTYKAGATGGEATHTLTAAEMPAHSHGISTSGDHSHYFYGSNNNNGPLTEGDGLDTEGNGHFTRNERFTTSSAGAHTHTISNSGGGAAHNNMSPYLVCYIWQRTA